MPKITVHGGPTNARVPDLNRQPSPGVYEVVSETPAEETGTDYTTWSFTDLRTEARTRGLPSGGTADDLRARLVEDDEASA
jgi:hypothetical protein